MKYFSDRNIVAELPEIFKETQKGNGAGRLVQNNHYLIKVDARSHASVGCKQSILCSEMHACDDVCGFEALFKGRPVGEASLSYLCVKN